MSLAGLSTCACGHVANHHSRPNGCHVSGCPCRAFDAGNISRERHNEVVREANRRIRTLIEERDALRVRVKELES